MPVGTSARQVRARQKVHCGRQRELGWLVSDACLGPLDRGEVIVGNSPLLREGGLIGGLSVNSHVPNESEQLPDGRPTKEEYILVNRGSSCDTIHSFPLLFLRLSDSRAFSGKPSARRGRPERVRGRRVRFNALLAPKLIDTLLAPIKNIEMNATGVQRFGYLGCGCLQLYAAREIKVLDSRPSRDLLTSKWVGGQAVIGVAIERKLKPHLKI